MNASDFIPDSVSLSDQIRAVHDAAVMTSDNAVESGSESLRVGRIVSEWYAQNPDIRQLWVYEEAGTDPDDTRDIHVIVVLAPVCDSDETGPIWLARSTAWQRYLQSLIGRSVHLDCFDGNTEVMPYVEAFEQGLVCLGSTAWRVYGDEIHQVS